MAQEAWTELAKQAAFLRTLTEAEIKRGSANDSTLVRCGLLLDIIDMALTAPEMAEALEFARDHLIDDPVRSYIVERIDAALARARGDAS